MYILYDGPSARSDNIHTVSEFINIMNRIYVDTDAYWSISIPELDTVVTYTIKWYKWNLPDDLVLFTLEDWLRFTNSSAFE